MKDLVFSLLPFKEKIGYWIAKPHIYQPIFLVGCGRSGTTALGRAIGHHPNIRGAFLEGALINHIGGVASHYCCHEVSEYVSNTTNMTEDSFVESLVKLVYEVVWGANYGLRSALSDYLGKFGKSVPGKWLAKAFPDEREHAGLRFLFPKAKYIYLYRNGLGVVNSMTKFGWFAEQSFEVLCNFWVDHMKKYSYLEASGDALVVKFEDFIDDPESVLNRVFYFISIEKSNAAIKYAQTRVVHPLDQEDIDASPKEMLNKRPPAYINWTKEQKSLFKDICESTMIKYGYDIPF